MTVTRGMEDLTDLDKVRDDIKRIMQENKETFQKLIDLVDQHDAIVKKVVDTLRSMAGETATKIVSGPFVATPYKKTTFDLNQVRKILPDKEWKKLVQSGAVRVELKADASGVRQIQELKKGYPELAKLESEECYKVTVTGPKAIDLSELVSIGMR